MVKIIITLSVVGISCILSLVSLVIVTVITAVVVVVFQSKWVGESSE
jgi:hypothetical protein